MLKNVWSDPVWSKVISAGIIAAIAGAWALLTRYVPGAMRIHEVVLAFIVETTPIQNWVIGVVALSAIWLVFAYIAKSLQNKTPAKPEWLQYRKDSFLGIDWAWSWSASWQIVNVHSLCPRCQCQIDAKCEDRFPYGQIYRFDCDLCEFKAEPQSGTYAEIERKVIRMAEQKIRTNSWPRVAL